jgi:hypothetical protein
MSMKLRHAAALTLVGWYLMMPPTLATTSWTCAGGLKGRIADAWIGSAERMDNCTRWTKVADIGAPFPQWSGIGAFDTNWQCEAQRGQNLLKQDNPIFPGPPPMQQRCIATGDLKRN